MLDINSPCVRNCCLDDEDICLGCFRSIEEIMRWGGANDKQKRQIMHRAKARKNERQIKEESRVKKW